MENINYFKTLSVTSQFPEILCTLCVCGNSTTYAYLIKQNHEQESVFSSQTTSSS